MKRMAVLLVALSAAAPGFAAPSPEPPPERLLWEERWDDALCSLIRRRTGERPVSFGIALSPTARMMFVQLNFEGPPLESGGLEVKVELFFSPGEAPEPLVFHVGRDGNRNHLLSFADMSFLDRLARARSIRFGDSHVYPTIDLGDAAKAVAGLRACRDGILRDWGVDSAALDALRRPPELEMPPSLRLAWKEKGDTRPWASRRILSRLDVSSQGRVTGCKIVVGTRGADIDAKVCDLWLRKARFKPALGPDGAPTAATILTDFIWKIP